MYIQEQNITEDLAVWARPFAFHLYGKITKRKKKKNKTKSQRQSSNPLLSIKGNSKRVLINVS
jgi:hypothetical protein